MHVAVLVDDLEQFFAAVLSRIGRHIPEVRRKPRRGLIHFVYPAHRKHFVCGRHNLANPDDKALDGRFQRFVAAIGLPEMHRRLTEQTTHVA
jgi:hypothetical protein